MSDETTILYRPVGEKDLALIATSGYRAFPPRLFWQPIFYPVLNEEYARNIAGDWNTRDGKHGYVTRFANRKTSRVQPHISARQFGELGVALSFDISL